MLLGGGGVLLVLVGGAALLARGGGGAAGLFRSLAGVDPAESLSPEWVETLSVIGQGLLLRGGLLLAATVWLLFPHIQARVLPLLQRRAVLVGGAIVALLLLWLPITLAGYSTTIAGERYWWLFDDMMISMRYGRNLAAGHGLVWNPGEYVEGYTNFLWTVSMGVLHLFPIPPSKMALVVGLTSIVLAVATIPLLLRLVDLLGGGTLAAGAVLVSYLLSLSVQNWTNAGTETSLLAMLFLFGACRVVDEAHQQRPTLPTYLLIGIMTLVRSDALVLAGLLYGLSLVLNPHKKAVIGYAALSLLLPAAHMAFRWFYYGDLVPNTAYLKVANWDGKYAHGVQYVAAFATDYSILLVFALLGALVSRSREMLLLFGILVVHAAYVVNAGGDAFPHYRFFVSVLPLLFVLTAVAIEKLTTSQHLRLLFVLLCLVSMPLYIPGNLSPMYPRTSSIGNIKIGLLLKENAAPGSRVADTWAGLVFYFSEAYGIDLLGKSDPVIARLPALYGDIPGHNKFDFDYSLDTLRPDFVVSNWDQSASEDDLLQLAQDIPWKGHLYTSEVFQTHCLPYPVPVATWRTVYACDWSAQVEERDSWVVPFDL